MKKAFCAMSVVIAILMFCAHLSAQTAPPNLDGQWKISWQARIGKEAGTLQFERGKTPLQGIFRGHGSPASVDGTREGNNVSFRLHFRGSDPFTLNFTGTLDGDAMSGVFQIEGLRDGYDSHGENVQQPDYRWSATRQINAGQTNTGQANAGQTSVGQPNTAHDSPQENKPSSSPSP